MSAAGSSGENCPPQADGDLGSWFLVPVVSVREAASEDELGAENEVQPTKQHHWTLLAGTAPLDAKHQEVEGDYFRLSDEEDEDGGGVGSLSVSSQSLFDLSLLASLIQSADVAIQQVQGRNVVILVGNTGTGKSTFVHFLAGCQLQRRPYKQGSSLKRWVYEAAQSLDDFRIGHDLQSETKHIIPFEREDSGVVYLDSPGYEDTAGPEVDFATSISYQKVAATCGQLRFLVLVSCASFLDNRGGAIRSLTKLLSSLVHGFDTHKLAFSFLFTHVHLLADAHHLPTDRPEGEYLAIAKEKVAALLSETLEGTDKKDKQSRDILRWLMKCAEKGVPFLDVFHPELSDREVLIAAIENFQVEGKAGYALGSTSDNQPANVVRCGMTQKMDSKIRIELHRCLEALSHNVSSEDFPKARAKLLAIGSLLEHAPLDCVQEAWQKAVLAVQMKQLMMEKAAYDLVEQGTSDDADFSVVQAERAIQCIKQVQTCEQLCSMGKHMPHFVKEGTLVGSASKDLHSHLTSSLASLVQRLCSDFSLERSCTALPSFKHARLQVSKLSAWSLAWFEGQADVADLCAKAGSAINSYVKFSLSEARNICRAEGAVLEEEPSRAVAGVVRIAHLCDHLSFLGSLGLQDDSNLLAVKEACAISLERLRQSVAKAVTEGIKALSRAEQVYCFEAGDASVEKGQQLFEDQASLQAFRRHAEHVEVLSTTLSSWLATGGSIMALGDVTAYMEAAEKQLQEGAVDELTSLSLQVRRALRLRQLQLVEAPLLAMARLQQCALTQRQLCTGGCQALCDEARNAAESEVRALAHSLSDLSEQLLEGRQGLPLRYPELLRGLQGCLWLDAMLSSEQQFVATALSVLCTRHASFLEAACREVQSALQGYLADSPQLPDETCRSQQLGELQAVWVRASGGLAELQEVDPAVTEVQTRLEQTVQGLIASWRSSREDQLCDSPGVPRSFPCSLEELRSLPAQSMDDILRIHRELQFMRPAMVELQTIAAWAADCSEHCSGIIEEMQPCAGLYLTKYSVMTILATWEGQGLHVLLGQLPSLAKLRKVTRQEIEARADAIRAMMRGALDSVKESEVAAAIRELEESRQLDALLEGCPSREIDGLSQLLAARREDVGPEVRAGLAAFSFQGPREQLEPKDPKDEAECQRCQLRLDLVKRRVEARIAETEQRIGSGPEAVRSIAELDSAAKEVGDVLLAGTLLDVGKEVERLTESCRTHFRGLLNQLEHDVDKRNYGGILEKEGEADAYLLATDTLQSKGSKSKAKTFKRKAEDSIGTVKHMVSAFVDNLEKAASDREDHSDLVMVLDSLRKAAASPDVERFHKEQVTILESGLLSFHEGVQAHVKRSRSYSSGVEAYAFLKRVWETGMRRHLLDMKFDIDKELDSMQKEEEAQTERFERWLHSEDDIVQQWKPSLDHLRPQCQL
ncbi:unnamed protein product [Polarella glacialis]|uniref:Uncharacterized protein n=1 Tax=Polarella glacialis TaxID=89957 RepID=A0A813IKC8_POLGL|nr:unnamed protein product [Polarella glacialis]